MGLMDKQKAWCKVAFNILMTTVCCVGVFVKQVSPLQVTQETEPSCKLLIIQRCKAAKKGLAKLEYRSVKTLKMLYKNVTPEGDVESEPLSMH